MTRTRTVTSCDSAAIRSQNVIQGVGCKYHVEFESQPSRADAQGSERANLGRWSCSSPPCQWPLRDRPNTFRCGQQADQGDKAPSDKRVDDDCHKAGRLKNAAAGRRGAEDAAKGSD